MSADIESGTGNDKPIAALSPPSSRANEVESNSLSHGDSFATGNTSPLSAHLSRCSQNKDPSVTSVGNVNIENHKAKGVCTEGKASCVGKENESIAFRMERLRRKKEEIEQVIMLLKAVSVLCQVFDVSLFISQTTVASKSHTVKTALIFVQTQKLEPPCTE